jgi:quinol monooxygenase YgiN
MGELMIVVVAGWFDVEPAERERFLQVREERVARTRRAPGCLAYALSSDAGDPGRVWIFERWESRAALELHRQRSRSEPNSAAVAVAVITRAIAIYEVSSVESLD